MVEHWEVEGKTIGWVGALSAAAISFTKQNIYTERETHQFGLVPNKWNEQSGESKCNSFNTKSKQNYQHSSSSIPVKAISRSGKTLLDSEDIPKLGNRVANKNSREDAESKHQSTNFILAP